MRITKVIWKKDKINNLKSLSEKPTKELRIMRRGSIFVRIYNKGIIS